MPQLQVINLPVDRKKQALANGIMGMGQSIANGLQDYASMQFKSQEAEKNRQAEIEARKAQEEAYLNRMGMQQKAIADRQAAHDQAVTDRMTNKAKSDAEAKIKQQAETDFKNWAENYAAKKTPEEREIWANLGKTFGYDKYDQKRYNQIVNPGKKYSEADEDKNLFSRFKNSVSGLGQYPDNGVVLKGVPEAIGLIAGDDMVKAEKLWNYAREYYPQASQELATKQETWMQEQRDKLQEKYGPQVPTSDMQYYPEPGNVPSRLSLGMTGQPSSAPNIQNAAQTPEVTPIQKLQMGLGGLPSVQQPTNSSAFPMKATRIPSLENTTPPANPQNPMQTQSGRLQAIGNSMQRQSGQQTGIPQWYDSMLKNPTIPSVVTKAIEEKRRMGYDWDIIMGQLQQEMPKFMSLIQGQ